MKKMMDDVLIDFLKNELNVHKLSVEDDLFDIGLDSFTISQIVFLIEKKYGVQLKIDDVLIYDNFSSVRNIQKLINLYTVSK